jgi:AcrR family transcriptional regulator
MVGKLKSGNDNPDERVRRSKELVLATTFQLLQEGGIAGVSIDEVSRRSGVAKTTIYRHWTSRAALLMDACSKLRPRDEAPDTGSLQGDVTAHLQKMAARMQGPGWPSILPSIIDAAERDQELAQLQARLQGAIKEPLLIAVERAKKRGELAGREDASEIVASLVGPLVYRRWFSREPIDERFVKATVANLLRRVRTKR